MATSEMNQERWVRFCEILAENYPGEVPVVPDNADFREQGRIYAEICSWLSKKIQKGEPINAPGFEALLG